MQYETKTHKIHAEA